MKFELPYNFNYDGKYFDYLHEIDTSYIESIYLPIYSKKNDFVNTRENLIYFPSSQEEYDSHIKKLQEEKIPLTFLIQRFLNKDIIEDYINKYNEKRFIINDDTIAKELKNKYQDNIHLTLSITRKLTYEDICRLDLSMYDNICLLFYFPHHLQVIRNLPNKYKYICLCNSTCLTNCPHPENHWFNLDNTFSRTCIVKRMSGLKINMKNSSFIRPEDLYLFEPYIETFKLEGREFPSATIIDTVESYINRKSNYKMIIYNFNFSDVESNYCQSL